jgi:prophage regulatory protein
MKQGSNMQERLMFQPQLKEIVPFSRTTIWRLEKAGKFPKRRKVSPGRVGWLASEIEAFLEQLPEAQRGKK